MSVGEHAHLLADEIEEHLRALLRDVICGHLSGELVALADSLLVEDDAPTARAGRTRTVRARATSSPSADDWFGSLEDDYCAAEGEVSFGELAR